MTKQDKENENHNHPDQTQATSSIAGSGCEILIPFNERQPLKKIEQSIVKKYRKQIWLQFINAIKDFNQIEDGDHVAVAISGGKDSMLMAKLFQELKKHRKVDFQVEYISMDPGFHPNIRQLRIS